ncbi:hypothetical protein ES703_63416 [subsurface metagenome]
MHVKLNPLIASKVLGGVIPARYLCAVGRGNVFIPYTKRIILFLLPGGCLAKFIRRSVAGIPGTDNVYEYPLAQRVHICGVKREDLRVLPLVAHEIP